MIISWGWGRLIISCSRTAKVPNALAIRNPLVTEKPASCVSISATQLRARRVNGAFGSVLIVGFTAQRFPLGDALLVKARTLPTGRYTLGHEIRRIGKLRLRTRNARMTKSLAPPVQ